MLQNLELLDCRDNKLNSLSANFKNLSKLKSLDLSANQLTSFSPEILELPLKELSLIGNYIKTVPRDIQKLTALESLYLKRNLIDSLPSEMSGLGKLKVLNVEKNQLSEIPTIPGAIIRKDKNPLSLRYRATQFIKHYATFENALAGAALLGASYLLYSYSDVVVDTLGALANIIPKGAAYITSRELG